MSKFDFGFCFIGLRQVCLLRMKSCVKLNMLGKNYLVWLTPLQIVFIPLYFTLHYMKQGDNGPSGTPESLLNSSKRR